MDLIYLALACGLITTSFVYKLEARLHAESIVGGIPAAAGQHTYSVSIQTSNQHFCGGGILNNRNIITAAHCFINFDNNKFENYEYSVVAGVTKAHNLHEGRYRVKREVAKIYIPREYNPVIRDRKFDDIAILELKSDLGLNQFITNIVLPRIARPYPTYENRTAVVCSYGHNWVAIRNDQEFCSGSDCYEQRWAEVNIITNMACRNFYNVILDSHICGNMRQRSPAKPEGLCTGDSGAPLVIGDTIIGVVSSSPRGCREDLKPAIYTRVTSFIPFIINAMNGVRAPNMRLAKYEIRRYDRMVLVEQ